MMHAAPLESIDSASLRSLLAALDAEIERRRASEQDAARTRIRELAARAGLSADDFAPRPGPVFEAQRYQSGTSPNFTWSGRGRRPSWVSDHLAAGGSLDQLLIPR